MGVAKPSFTGLCKSTPGDCECTGELACAALIEGRVTIQISGWSTSLTDLEICTLALCATIIVRTIGAVFVVVGVMQPLSVKYLQQSAATSVLQTMSSTQQWVLCAGACRSGRARSCRA
jgi:hypothetical protein